MQTDDGPVFVQLCRRERSGLQPHSVNSDMRLFPNTTVSLMAIKEGSPVRHTGYRPTACQQSLVLSRKPVTAYIGFLRKEVQEWLDPLVVG